MILILCLACAPVTQAERLFRDSFAEAFHLTNNDILTGVSLTAAGDTVYRLLTDGDLYTWEPKGDRYALYAHVPAAPWAKVNVEIPFLRQSADVQCALTESVSQLIPAGDEIYGFNVLSGRIGLIDGDGWHSNGVCLDTAALWPSAEVYPERLRNAFITGGKLYAFHDINYSTSKTPQPTLLVFDLTNGACAVTEMPGTITCCRYTPGKLLCLQDNGTETPVLAVYELGSGRMTGMEIPVPVSIERKYFNQAFYLHCRIGGLAYDAGSDSVYLADTHNLWCSTAGGIFQQTANDLWAVWDQNHEGESMMTAEVEAWTLPSGGYIFQNGTWYVGP